MTDLFAYHLARQQLADLRKTAEHERLVRATANQLTPTRTQDVLSRLTTQLGVWLSARRI